MREQFLDEEVTKAEDVIKDHIGKTLNLVHYQKNWFLTQSKECVNKISQIPVIDINGFVGSVDESDLFSLCFGQRYCCRQANSLSNG
jgi:cystathionine beta-synthase